jgi:hypothetical protein
MDGSARGVREGRLSAARQQPRSWIGLPRTARLTGHDPIGGIQNPLAARLERGLVLGQRSTSGVRSVCHQAWIRAAYAPGFALALPQKVAVARATGFDRADAINIQIPIDGALVRLLAEGA